MSGKSLQGGFVIARPGGPLLPGLGTTLLQGRQHSPTRAQGESPNLIRLRWSQLKGEKCSNCGASRDYIKNTENGYRCSICGNNWKSAHAKPLWPIDIPEGKDPCRICTVDDVHSPPGTCEKCPHNPFNIADRE